MSVVRCETLTKGRRYKTTNVTTGSSVNISGKNMFRLHPRSSSLKMVAAVSSEMLAPSITLLLSHYEELLGIKQ